MFGCTLQPGAAGILQTEATKRLELLALLPLPLHSSGPVRTLPAAHPRPDPGLRSCQPLRGGPVPLYSQLYLPALRRAPARVPMGRKARQPTVSAQIVTVCACLQSATLSPHAGLWGRLPTVSAQAKGDGTSTPPVSGSFTPRRAAGQGAHSVGQGLTVTAAPTSDQHAPSVSQVYRGLLPTVLAPANCVNLRRPPLRVALLHSPGRGSWRPKCRPRATCDGCAYLQPAFPKCVIGLHEPGADLQCRPRANCDCSAYL